MRDDGGGVNHDLTIKIDERLIIDFFQYKMTTEKKPTTTTQCILAIRIRTRRQIIDTHVILYNYYDVYNIVSHALRI